MKAVQAGKFGDEVKVCDASVPHPKANEDNFVKVRFLVGGWSGKL